MDRFRIVLQNFEELIDEEDWEESQNRIDEEFDSPELLPVKTMDIRDYCIDVVDGWWPWFGQKLTYINMFRCQLDVQLLFEMLKGTVNLKKLIIYKTWFNGHAEEPDFRLVKMEELSLEYLGFELDDVQTNMLDYFRIMCPRLRRLKIRDTQNTINVHGLSRFIQALRSTLEGVEVNDPAAVDILGDFSGLRLKQASIHLNPSFGMVKFFRVQPLIEDLVIYAQDMNDDKVLCNIGRAVPKLRRLTLPGLKFTTTFNIGFLNFMPNLEYLSMNGSNYCHKLVMSNSGNARLKELYASGLEIEGFMKYLERSPQVRSIVFYECFLEACQNSAGEVILNHVKTFEVSGCGWVSCEMLEILYRQCPMLENITLGYEDRYNDEVVLMTCERLKHLRKLSMTRCRITDASVEHIIQHGLSLEEFTVSRNRISNGAAEKLRSTRNIRVTITN